MRSTDACCTPEYSDMWGKYYDNMMIYFDKAPACLAADNCIRKFLPRIKKIMKQSEVCGWGFSFSLKESYKNYTSK